MTIVTITLSLVSLLANSELIKFQSPYFTGIKLIQPFPPTVSFECFHFIDWLFETKDIIHSTHCKDNQNEVCL